MAAYESNADTSPDDAAISIVYDDFETDEGAKALFGTLRRRVTKIGVLDQDKLAANLSRLATTLSGAMEEVAANPPQSDSPSLRLEGFDVAVEVSAGGQIRLIGSASVQVKGGITLHFRRSTG